MNHSRLYTTHTTSYLINLVLIQPLLLQRLWALTRILTAEMGWPSNALQGVLLNALNYQMKDQLASSEELSFFEDFFMMVISIDNRLAKLRREKNISPHEPLPRSLPPRQYLFFDPLC